MSAAILENAMSEAPEKPKRRKVNRRTEKDRVQVLLKPHVRNRVAKLAEDEGLDSLGLMGRQLIMEALAARGFDVNTMLAEWHAEMSEYALRGETHPFAK